MKLRGAILICLLSCAGALAAEDLAPVPGGLATLLTEHGLGLADAGGAALVVFLVLIALADLSWPLISRLA